MNSSAVTISRKDSFESMTAKSTYGRLIRPEFIKPQVGKVRLVEIAGKVNSFVAINAQEKKDQLDVLCRRRELLEVPSLIGYGDDWQFENQPDTSKVWAPLVMLPNIKKGWLFGIVSEEKRYLYSGPREVFLYPPGTYFEYPVLAKDGNINLVRELYRHALIVEREIKGEKMFIPISPPVNAPPISIPSISEEDLHSILNENLDRAISRNTGGDASDMPLFQHNGAAIDGAATVT